MTPIEKVFAITFLFILIAWCVNWAVDDWRNDGKD
jgi:hypothetical protein